MRTVYISEFGDADVLEIIDVPLPPKPGPGEVKVRVEYAGVNRADILQRKGLYPPPPGFDVRRPGLEFAGYVEETGTGVTDIAAGDPVCGITSGEAQAEFIVVDQSLLVHSALPIEKMAAVPEAYVTAHDALIGQAALASGESVLIHAAASAVGLAAAQIARSFDASVFGTTRTPAKAEELMGSEHREWFDDVIVTSDGPVFAEHVLQSTDGRGVDVVIDLVGGAYFPENIKSLASKGRMVVVGLTAGRFSEIDLGALLSKRLTVKGTVLRSRPLEEKAMAVAGFRRDVAPHLAAGDFRPVIDRVFEMDEVRAAHRFVEENRNIGKVILKIARD